MKRSKFKFKVFTSFCLFLSFPVMTISGIILFISPKGRIANWIEWSFLGITREGWSSIHIVFMIIFLTGCILHIFWLNWKVFWSYIKSKSTGGIRFKMEFAASVVLTILFIFSIAFELPPIFSFYKFGENIKASYEIAENTPPIPHAESLTLKEFSELVLELSPEEARKTIIDAGYRVESVDEIIEDIAHNNDITPNDLLSIFKSTNTTNAQTDNYSGLGRKTLLMVCEDLQLDPDSALVILDIAEIEIENFEESIKSIAERAGINPIEIIKILED